MSAKRLAIIFGVVFLVAGLLGFVTNPLIGVSGFFMTDHGHDIFNLIVGVILLVVAQWYPMNSALWLKIIGIVWLIIAILGFWMVPLGGELFGFLGMNLADHWLHVIVGILMVIGGYTAYESEAMPAMGAM